MVFGMTALTGMNRKKVVLVSALTAATLGVAGLAALALPAGAGEEPSLPEISAEELVSSALAAQPPAMNGTIGVDSQEGEGSTFVVRLPLLASGVSPSVPASAAS